MALDYFINKKKTGWQNYNYLILYKYIFYLLIYIITPYIFLIRL